MKKTVIYYFSGTGNSLVVAGKMKKRLEDAKLVEISSALHLEEFKTKVKEVGFVFPCHNKSLPLPVKRFIKKLEMPKAKYVFAVVTRSDTDVKAFNKLNKILKKKNLKLDATFVVDMPSNDPRPAEFREPIYEEIAKIDKRINKIVGKIKSVVKNRGEHHDDVKLPNDMQKRTIKASQIKTKDACGRKKYFYITDDCIGCKVCQKVCMSGKIEMKKKKPSWDNSRDCYSCYACVNFCPMAAIQIHSKTNVESHTEENGRYHHPHVTYKDMLYRRRTK